MKKRRLDQLSLMKKTEEILLELGYGGFNFSVLSKSLGIGRSTLYEYYSSKDELIADYMSDLMDKFMRDLKEIRRIPNGEAQLLSLIQLMIKYAHIHHVLQMVELLNMDSLLVKFKKAHLEIIEDIQGIVEYGKKEGVVRKEIPTEVLVSLLFNTINKPSSIEMELGQWSEWIWEIIYTGIKPNK